MKLIRSAIKGLAIGIAVFTLFFNSTEITSFAKEETGPGIQQDRLLLVVGTDSYHNIFSSYTKTKQGWKKEFEIPGEYGRNGVSVSKTEGDGTTPQGEYTFSMAFGLKNNPGSILPYHQIQNGDQWVDDPNSQYYNQLVNTNQISKDWTSSESMMNMGAIYNYALALDYNTECIPGKGSAIFLHCMPENSTTGSAGCIRVPEEYVIQLINTVNQQTKIIIVPSEEELETYNLTFAD